MTRQRLGERKPLGHVRKAGVLKLMLAVPTQRGPGADLAPVNLSLVSPGWRRDGSGQFKGVPWGTCWCIEHRVASLDLSTACGKHVEGESQGQAARYCFAPAPRLPSEALAPRRSHVQIEERKTNSAAWTLKVSRGEKQQAWARRDTALLLQMSFCSCAPR